MRNNMMDYDYLMSRGVNELIHFTNIKNLENIKKYGLLPRSFLEEHCIHFIENDQKRFDGRNHLNLSITQPNLSFFYKTQCANRNEHYVVFGINPSILKDSFEGDYNFISTNFGSKLAKKVNVESLFLGDRSHLKRNSPTNNQAEIAYSKRIDIKYIDRIYVKDSKAKKIVESIFNDVEVIVTDIMHIYKKTPNNANREITTSEALFKLIRETTEATKSEVYQSFDGTLDNRLSKVKQRVYKYYLSNWFPSNETIDHTNTIMDTLLHEVTFDTIALTRKSLVSLYETDDTNTNIFWKIHFEGNLRNEIALDDQQLSALSVLEKILNRGSVTCLSRKLETYIELNYSHDTDKIINFVHQIQIIIIELVKLGALHKSLLLSVDDLDQDVLKALEDDLKLLDKNVSTLYGTPLFLNNIKLVTQGGDLSISKKYYGPNTIRIIDDCEACEKRCFISVNNRPSLNVTKEVLEYFLEYIFGFSTFRENQLEGIIKILSGQDAIVLLPTGSGKSVIYQLSSLLLPGMTVVIDPILSLATDQVENLSRQGINRVVQLDSQTKNASSVSEDIATGQYYMIFVSPERFQNPKFRNQISYFSNTNIIPLITIDEAHCVSEWGHDFRTSYLSIADTCRRICTTPSGSLPNLLGLTGTASYSVLRDMQRDLDIGDENVIRPTSFDRKEINFRVVNIPSREKSNRIESLLKNDIPDFFGLKDYISFYKPNKVNTNSGIVFSLFAGENSLSKGSRFYQKRINDVLGSNACGVYNGKMDDIEKRKYAKQFKNNEIVALSATKSFGMGIDKPNIRWTIHTGIPMSIEAFYQEVGRCARDGKPSVSWLLLSNDALDRNKKLLDFSETNFESLEVNAKKGPRDDISDALYLYLSSFTGISEEMNQVKKLLEGISNGLNEFTFTRSTLASIEKAVYRMVLIGYISDYTVDHGASLITIKTKPYNYEGILSEYRRYISGYQDDDNYLDNQLKYLIEATKDFEDDEFEVVYRAINTLLVEFIYKVIEEGKRNALRNMLEYSYEASKLTPLDAGGEYLRNRILEYLSTSDTFNFNEIINRPTDFAYYVKVIKKIKSKKKLASSVPQLQRILESYPQHLGIHYLLTVISSKTENESQFYESILLLLKYSKEAYNLSFDPIVESMVPVMSDVLVSDEQFNVLIQRFKNSLSKETFQTIITKIKSQHYKEILSLSVLNEMTREYLKSEAL